MADLVTGARGQAHITPKNDAVIHRGMMGVESCILDYGEKLAPALIPSQPTNIRILDGCGMMQGRFFEIEEGSYDTIAIPNGAQGYKRIDLVCAKITQNENGTQSFSWEVVQGTQTSGTPQPPTVAEHSLDDGDEFALMPIASVELEGVNIVAVETVAEIGQTLDGLEQAEIDRNTYSTSEKRIGTWIDGKPLYRKTFSTTLPLAASTDVTVGTISNASVVTHIYGSVKYGGINWANGTYVTVSENSGSVSVRQSISGSTLPNAEVIVVIEYTKTTD